MFLAEAGVDGVEGRVVDVVRDGVDAKGLFVLNDVFSGHGDFDLAHT